MDHILDYLDDPTVMLSLLVFLAAATLAFSVMAAVRVRSAVRRRAAEVLTSDAGRADNDPRSLRFSSRKAANQLLDYANRHFTGGGGDERKLRRQLIQAGFLDPRAVAYFFLARIATGLALGVAAFFIVPMVAPDLTHLFWVFV